MAAVLFDGAQATRKGENTIWLTLLGKSPNGRTGAVMLLECDVATALQVRDALNAAIESRPHPPARL